MKRLGKYLAAAAILMILAGLFPAAVSAEPWPTKYKGREYRTVYSYSFYTKKYPYVIKKVGSDPAKVLEYFVKCGMYYGQQAKKSFDVKEYYASHKNLRKILGTGYRNYYDYYRQYGRFGDGSEKAKQGIRIYSTTVCIDPGHQRRAMYSREPIGPGSGTYKIKVSSGTYGPWSRLNEYEVVLQIGLKLRDKLQAKGYKVVMTRTKHDVSISNAERARLANAKKADLMVRLHCDGEDYGSSLNGARGMAASRGNRYLKQSVVAGGQRLAGLLATYQAKATGQRRLETLYTNEMTGINWAQMPCAIIEMGYMSNPAEDRRLANSEFQDKIVTGLTNGIFHFVTD